MVAPLGASVRALFATRIYDSPLIVGPEAERIRAEVEATVLVLAREDRVGRAWCRSHGYDGYTSYASLDDLPRRATIFGELKRSVDRHVSAFADQLGFDLGGRRLRLNGLWVNMLKPRAAHSGHIHPQSVISGTYYVRTPPGSAGIRFEDPRLGLMMAAPPPRSDLEEPDRRFVDLQPIGGDLLLWESWLRHEVPRNGGRVERVSVSFNYAWG